jgi:hypothetical protein
MEIKMGNVIVGKFGAPPARFQGKVTDEYTSGIETSFALIGYRGKAWSIKFKGNNTPMMRLDDPTEPMTSIEVIVVAASKFKSKVYYRNGYQNGSKEKPTCFSSTAVKPDHNAQEPQASACVTCPHNVIGSGPNGRGRACSDSKRVVIVPANDIENVTFGGPMLLRIPAGSLNDFALYAERMQKQGYPLYAIETKIGFLPEAYPKFRYTEVRPLTDAEIDKIEALRETPQVKRILAEATEHVEETVEEAPAAVPVIDAPPTAPVNPEINSEAVVDLDEMTDPALAAKLDALLPA